MTLPPANASPSSAFQVRYQHYVFYPIMLFARYNLYAQSLIFLLTSPDHRVKNRRLELLTLAMYATWMGVLLAHVPGGWGKTVAYLTVMHAVTGFQHVLICVGHFPRETYVDRPLATAGGERLETMTWYSLKNEKEEQVIREISVCDQSEHASNLGP
jgi:hypothetical protein